MSYDLNTPQVGALSLESTHFDGHTDFSALTFTQKLTWLSEAVLSVYCISRENDHAGCCAFFNKAFHDAG